jgi:hypothetical protein
MSPTVLRWKGYRVFFFSREESRAHVHVYAEEGEAKFWLVPTVELARNHGLAQAQVAELLKMVQEKQNDFLDAWREHFMR